jgi:glycosyltransferase involved in cell wall biosynthesis
MDRAVVDALKRLPERRRFMKGLFAWVGFRTSVVEYERELRQAGSSKFSGWRLWNLALEGITSFSEVPLIIWTYFGFLVSVAAFGLMLVIVVQRLFLGLDIPGYALLSVAILFLGGVQLVGIGILGEYVGRIYSEVKARPIYIVRRRYGGDR